MVAMKAVFFITVEEVVLFVLLYAILWRNESSFVGFNDFDVHVVCAGSVSLVG